MLVPPLLLAAWAYVGLTYLWDTADGWRLGGLIFVSVGCGIGLGQLPPVRFLLRRDSFTDAEERSATRTS